MQPRNTYNPTYLRFWPGQSKQSHTKLRQNTCILFTPDPAEYKSNLNLKINNTALPMATHPKVLCLTFDPKLTHSHHLYTNTHVTTNYKNTLYEYKSNLNLIINNTAPHMATHPKVLCLTLDPKLTYSTHIHNISIQTQKPLQMIKTLTATGWGKQKETPLANYKAVMRLALQYASSIWSPLTSSTSINKLLFM